MPKYTKESVVCSSIYVIRVFPFHAVFFLHKGS